MKNEVVIYIPEMVDLGFASQIMGVTALMTICIAMLVVAVYDVARMI